MIEMTACEPVPAVLLPLMNPQFIFTKFGVVFAALVTVIGIKALFFAWFSDVGWSEAMGAMVIANIVSTFPGLAIGFSLSPPFQVFPVLLCVVILWVSTIASRFWRNHYAPGHPWLLSEPACATAMVVLALGSTTCFMEANELMHAFDAWDKNLPHFYWKIASLFMGLLLSLFLTIGIEGLVVLEILKDKQSDAITMRAAIMANLWTFLFIFFIGAIIALPQRLSRVDWLLPAKRDWQFFLDE